MSRVGEEALEQQPEELQRDILEGQRRAVEQLEQQVAMVELDERRDGGVGEAAIGGLAAAPAARRRSSAPPTKGSITRDRGLDIGEPGERRDLGLAELRPGLGHVQPAVGGEPGQRHGFEIERGRPRPGC